MTAPIPPYNQVSPAAGKFIDSENNIIDTQEMLESGQIVVTATNSPSPVTPIGPATTPLYQNLAALAGKIVNSENEIIDLYELLTSGAIQVQVAGGVAPPDATYITSADETASLPNSVQLLGTTNQITVTNGVLSLPNLLIAPENFRLPNGNMQIGSNLLVSSNSISTSADLNLSPGAALNAFAATDISLVSGVLGGAGDFSAVVNGTGGWFAQTNGGDINFSTDSGAYYFGINGVNIIDLNGSGFRIGEAGARVTSISTSASATGNVLMNADAVQMAIAAQITSAKSFRGGYNASTNLFPTTGGTGIAGAVAAGDVWEVTTPGTLGGTAVHVGNTILALVDLPGQTAGNWVINVNGVATVFGRAGIITAQSGDYSFNLISGTAQVSQGGTGATTAQGAMNTFAGAVTSGQYLRGNGSNVVMGAIQASDVPTLNQSTTGQAGSVAGITQYNIISGGAASAINNIAPSTSGYVLASNGPSAQPSFQSPTFKSYGVFVPFLSNKIISGSGFATQSGGSSIDIFSFNGTSQFQYQYFLYLKCGVTYRFSAAFFKTTDSGILSGAILSSDGLTTYNTLSAIDNYKSGGGATWNINQQTFSFSPAGFSNGDWVPCIFNCACNSKNASSTNYYILGVDPGAGFSFSEKYS